MLKKYLVLAMDILEFRKNHLKSILLLEDEIPVSRMYYNVLTSAGFNVFNAHDVKSAINKLQNQKIDLAIIDLLLPVSSGVELLTYINTNSIKIITVVLTNVFENGEYNAGVLESDYYLEKSDYTPVQILSKILEILK